MNFTTDDERGSRRQLRIPMRMTMSLQKTRTIDDGVEQEDEECSTMTPFPRVRGCDHMIPVLLQLLYVWLSKLWSLFGSLLSYGTYYLGYPKRNPNLTTTHMTTILSPIHLIIGSFGPLGKL